MHDDSAVALIQAEAEDDVAARHLEAVAAVVVESQRPSTRKAYAAAWKRFQDWAEEEGVTSFPADPVTVAAYLVHRDATGLSFASLAMDRKGISFFHRRAGIPSPTASEGVKMTMAGVRNRAAERGRSEPRQARGLREAGLRAIVDTAHIPRIYPSGRMESREAAILRGAVDIAIASVMRDALNRIRPCSDVAKPPTCDGPTWSSELTEARASPSDVRRPPTGRSSSLWAFGRRQP